MTCGNFSGHKRLPVEICGAVSLSGTAWMAMTTKTTCRYLPIRRHKVVPLHAGISTGVVSR